MSYLLPVRICRKKVFENFLAHLFGMQGKANETLLRYIKTMNEEKINDVIMELGEKEFRRKNT